MSKKLTILFKDDVTIPEGPKNDFSTHHARNQATYKVTRWSLEGGGVVHLRFPNCKLTIERDAIISYYEQ